MSRYAARAAGEPAGHLDEAAWERLACAEGEPAERERAFDHVTRCTECAAVWRSLSSLRREAAAFDPAAPRARTRPEAPARWVVAGLAAAAVLVAASVTLMPAARRGPSVAEPTRSRTDAARPRALSPVGRVVAAPAEFRWEAVPGARAYRVRVYRDAELLWSSAETPGTTLAWPATLQLSTGRYFWQVVAIPSWGRAESDQLLSDPAPLEVGSGR
jgi:hypothetical protein